MNCSDVTLVREDFWHWGAHRVLLSASSAGYPHLPEWHQRSPYWPLETDRPAVPLQFWAFIGNMRFYSCFRSCSTTTLHEELNLNMFPSHLWYISSIGFEIKMIPCFRKLLCSCQHPVRPTPLLTKTWSYAAQICLFFGEDLYFMPIHIRRPRTDDNKSNSACTNIPGMIMTLLKLGLWGKSGIHRFQGFLKIEED